MTRRSFSKLMVGAVALCVGLSSSRATAAEDKLAFELYADKAGQFRWRLKAANAKVLATSGEGYAEKATAKGAIERIQRDAETLASETYEDAGHEYRWRLKAKNGQIIAASSEGYKARADADKAVTLVKTGAKDAAVVDLTKS